MMRVIEKDTNIGLPPEEGGWDDYDVKWGRLIDRLEKEFIK